MGSLSRTVSFWKLAGIRQSNPHPPDAPVLVEDERRVWLRFPSGAETTYQSVDARENLQATIRNVSRGGMALLVDRCFEPGSLLTVELPANQPSLGLAVLACVVHATEESSGRWVVGCTFAREIGDEDLQALAAKGTSPDIEEKRTRARYPCAITGSYQILADDDQAPYSAKVLNISASGVLLLVTAPLETGILLNLQLSGPRGGDPQTILACVVHRRCESQGEWAVGCNFIRELSEEELGALV
jgi:c-di-GMP-binding flagellar brake protein YcgR